jgi:sulfur carrier protein
MSITLNGSIVDITLGATVLDVVTGLDLPDRGVALALDGEVVPRSAWPHTVVPDRSRVEVVAAMQGG